MNASMSDQKQFNHKTVPTFCVRALQLLLFFLTKIVRYFVDIWPREVVGRVVKTRSEDVGRVPLKIGF